MIGSYAMSYHESPEIIPAGKETSGNPRVPAGVNAAVASPARVYDYWPGRRFR
jgi:hypothetical protein